MNDQTSNSKLQTSKESIIAKLRGRLKLDQQTAEEILESPEIEYSSLIFREDSFGNSQRLARSRL